MKITCLDTVTLYSQSITVCQRTARYPFVHSSTLFFCFFFSIFHYCHVFHVTLFSGCAFFMLHFFVLHCFCVALWSSCIISMLEVSHIEFSHVAIVLHFFHVAFSFKFSTFFILGYFHATIFSISFFSCCIFFVLHSFHVALFSCFTSLASLHFALFS